MSKQNWFGRRVVAGVAAALVGLAAAASAGTSQVPDNVLDSSDATLLSAPALDFRFELRRIALPADPDAASYEEGQPQSLSTETDELTEALARAGVRGAAAERVAAQYAEARKVMFAHKGAVQAERWRQRHGAAPRRRLRMPDVALPVAVPTEFVLYMRGALAYHQRRFGDARAEWRRLLELPATERRYRSVWAAYMIGRSLVAEDVTEAAAAFALCRRLRRDGFRDLLGLASESLGWEARAELEARRFGRACELYLAQFHAAAPYDDGPGQSLRMVGAAMAREDPAKLTEVATHPVARAVMTAYVVCHGGPRGWGARPATTELQRAWLAAVETVAPDAMESADRLAWAAYQLGDMDAAERWLGRAGADAPLAGWVRAKLLLRAGRIDEGAAMLAEVSGLFPPDLDWGSVRASHRRRTPSALALAESGALRLARGQYVESLDTLFRAGYWEDVAYVAERVLTLEELREYVDRAHPDDSAERPERFEHYYERRKIASWTLRWLLARRLARRGRLGDARPYFPAELRRHLDEYAVALSVGRDDTLDAPRRATALRKAARIARHHGMELIGTEDGPDWVVWGGYYSSMSTAERRAGSESLGLLRPTPDEVERAARHGVDPDKRFHYRYVALEHAWAAASLMPDDSEQTARFLWEAGSWVKDRDPTAADRFYKALALRCRNTPLGAEAFRLHWFPRKLDGNDALILTGIGADSGD